MSAFQPHIIILIGPPGSGKSTLAKHIIETDYGNEVIYVNQDTQDKAHLQIFNDAITARKHVLVDRMNFNKQQRERYLAPAKKAGYSTKIIVLHESRYICLDRCAKRENHPTIKTREDRENAVGMFFSKYERPTLDEADTVEFRYPNRDKPNAVIFDLDGTLCNVDHRLHYVQREGKKDWASFFRGISDDKPNEWCMELVKTTAQNNSIVFCSGRADNYREVTEEWLKKFGVWGHDLFMRPRNDMRDDSIIKEILLDFEILTRYKPRFAVDDRLRVVQMWRRRGITCLQCADGNF